MEWKADSWSKKFLEAGKKCLAGDTEREASSGDVSGLRKLAARLPEEDRPAHMLTITDRLFTRANDLWKLGERDKAIADLTDQFELGWHQ